MEFEWDEHNRHKNWQKRGVSVSEAEAVFDNGLFLGPVFSGDESRFAVIGPAPGERVLFTVYTLREGKIRVISARDASRKERQFYEEKRKQNKENSKV